MHSIKARSSLVPPILACLLVCGYWVRQGACETANDVTPKPQERTLSRPKAPFRVLYSNDTTNIEGCLSPYHKKGQPFTEEMLRASVDEAAGVDVHLLQPGLCWIPWWKSKVYPADEHYRLFEQQTGLKAGSWGQYMLNGGDMVKVFIERCRQKHQSPFISFRLNDTHHCLLLSEYAGTPKQNQLKEMVSKFYEDHPEYRIGTDRWGDGAFNWAIPEVREHKFSLIKEICEQYDIDGFELDFMRFPNFFQLDKTTKEERCRIMTEFVRQVRQLLDRTARSGQHRWLCARVPAFLVAHERLGIDLPAMAKAGLDMINASTFFCTVQQSDLAAIRKLVPEAGLYLEMTHCTTYGPNLRGHDSGWFCRTTDHQFYTGAHLAYTDGADGISLFNFVYYRGYGKSGRGPFNEPPFHVLKYLGQPDWLAKQPQWYVLAKAWNDKALGVQSPLPLSLRAGQTQTLELNLAPTAAQIREGILRIRTEHPSSHCKWTVKLNNVGLAATGFVAKPIAHPYDAGLGEPNQYACFACPRSLAKKGTNTIAVTLNEGPAAKLIYLDLVLP